MHVTYLPENTQVWLEFYKSTISTNPQYQFGGELPGFRAYAAYHHRGAGLGSFFKSLFRMALPLLKSAGKHALSSGSRIAADLSQGRDLKDSLKEHGRNAAGALLHETADRIQKGKGLGKRRHTKRNVVPYKRRHVTKKQSLHKIRLPRVVGSKDIFSH